MRPHWLPHRRMEDVSEMDSFLPPRIPTEEFERACRAEEEASGKAWAAILTWWVLAVSLVGCGWEPIQQFLGVSS